MWQCQNVKLTPTKEETENLKVCETQTQTQASIKCSWQQYINRYLIFNYM